MLFLLVNLSAVKAQVDPDTTERAGIDRFSMEAGHLFVRDSSNGLPSPNEPIDFDQGPFITDGFGPNGELISYYNFDVQPTEPAPIYVLFRGEESMPVAGQLNIVDDVPGDSDYNDFWRVIKVTVPANYVANTVTSLDQITMAAYPVDTTDMIVNCPVVPEGSTAKLRYSQQEDTGLTMGWYKGKVIFYFNFSEKALSVDGQGMVPLSPIYVSFNINPGEDGGGPPSGFKTDTTGRAHNVAASLPEDEGYSPFWLVNIYDNADFDNVYDLTSAQAANLLTANAANVNCPIVSVESATSVENTSSALPAQYSLSQNYPNPFNPFTVIDFTVVNSEHVSLKIYNSIGQEVTELINENLPPGYYSVDFDAASLSSGVYFYTIRTQHFVQTKKMLLLK